MLAALRLINVDGFFVDDFEGALFIDGSDDDVDILWVMSIDIDDGNAIMELSPDDFQYV